MLLTELTVDPEEFDSYNIGVNSEITFCLKELRVGNSLCTVTALILPYNGQI